MSKGGPCGVPGWALAGAILIALVPSPACGKRGAKKIPRSKDAAPAVVVEEKTPAGVTFAEEKEPNNTAESPGRIAVPGGIRGTLDGETDVDLYGLEVAGAGFLSAQVGGIEGVDLVLELRDAKGESLARSDRGPALVSEGIPGFPVAEGKYQVVVSEFVKKSKKRKRRKKGRKAEPVGRTGPSPTYELVVQLSDEPAEGLEAEPNDAAEQAREILIGDEAFGFLGWNKDQDLWALSLEGFSPGYAIDIDVSPVGGVWMSLEILDVEGNVLVKRTAERGKGVRVYGLVPGEGAERYFARLSSRRSNPEEKYSLRPTRRLLDLDEEAEPNDLPATAMALSDDPKEAEGTRRGYFMPGDTDCFRVPSRSEASLLTVTVEPPAGVDILLDVFTEAGAALGESDRGKRGASESLSAVPVPPNTAVIIKIGGMGDAEPTAYQLRWSLAPGGVAPAPDPTDEGYEDEP
jgi:hypothetical protein